MHGHRQLAAAAGRRWSRHRLAGAAADLAASARVLSNVRVNAAVWLWARANWRRRQGAIVGLVLLTGFAGAVVLMVAAGARRTATSLERLSTETRSADVAVDVGNVDAATIQHIGELPIVADSGAFSIVFALVDGVEADLGLWIPHDEQIGVTVERDRLVRGRRPRPDQNDEVTINELAAELAGVDAGDDITIATLSPEQVADEDYFPPRGPELRLHIVGVTRGPSDLIERGEAAFVASPALADTVAGRADVFTTFLAVRLVPGNTVAQFDDAVHRLVGTAQDLDSLSFDVRTEPARGAISALAAGLAIFGIVAATASIALVGQAVGRHLWSAAGDQDVLGAIGMARSARVRGLVLLVVPIAVGGAALAVIGAVVASPTMPIGLARRAEPDPGFDVDGWVVALGFVAVAAVVVVSAALVGWLITRDRQSSPTPALSSAAAVAVALRSGAGPVGATGIRLALDRRPPALPVRSAIGGATVAVLGMVAVLTFSASLDRLVRSPGRWGYSWDLLLNFTSADVERAADEIAGDESLAGVARWDSGFSYVNGEGSRAFGLTPLRGDVGFSLRSGHQPARSDEIVLGPATAEKLAVTVGDRVDIASGPDATAAAAHVVGIALFPEIDDGDFTDAIGYYGSAFAAHATVPDLFEASQIVLTFASGHDRDDVTARLNDRFPGSVSAEGVPRPPGSVGNLLGVRGLPRWTAAFVATLGLASLAHMLVSTQGRRRHELATLRCLGLTPRQTTACIVWQAVTIVVAGLVLGIPLGLTAGRAAWWAVADPIGVRTEARWPMLGVIAVCAGVLVAATLVAIPVGRQAGRRTPTEALHVE